MESDIGCVESSQAERLNGAIKVHVKDSVLTVITATNKWRQSISNKENAIVSRIRFNLVHRGASICPGLDSRLHSHRVTNWGKKEIRRTATDRKLLIGEIVKHVALARMRLAPGVFMGADVCRFAIISRAGVLGWDQVSHVNQDPVRHTVVVVAVVIVGGRWERSRERIDPCARTDAVLVAIQT